jgi:DUF4097 and DUF4098 domain-containing protein YvlB
MMLATAALALVATVGVQQQTDTTVPVPAGARLSLSNHAGSIRVTAWDRSEMRVRAAHGSRDVIEIDVRGAVVRVRADRRYGVPAFVEYDITVPRAMAVDLDGVETDITVDGVGGDVSAGSVEGGVTVRGAGGAVKINSVEGDLIVDGGRGRISAEGVDGSVQITGARGDITVETVDGDVTLEEIESASVDVGTVEGTITYAGTIQDGGQYRLTSHEGDVVLDVSAGLNATVSVATFEGSFEADPAFRVQLTSARPGRRFSFTLGTGSARVELETFEGEIRLRGRQ